VQHRERGGKKKGASARPKREKGAVIGIRTCVGGLLDEGYIRPWAIAFETEKRRKPEKPAFRGEREMQEPRNRHLSCSPRLVQTLRKKRGIRSTASEEKGNRGSYLSLGNSSSTIA